MKAIADPGLPPRATPKNFLVAWLLVLLRRSHLHGYEIMKELRDEFGIACDHGALYRTLRQLEARNLIRSHWDAADLGPARRVYELTDAGGEALVAWSDALGGYRASLEKFFRLYHGLTGN
ncbi:MAG TPA: helix-turn-helix transcriptional regulator [Candidatus Lustribacter sp.]|nr:helix-turn-helix transcriptional regulator [Candidatus Lustribacter sp.]